MTRKLLRTARSIGVVCLLWPPQLLADKGGASAGSPTGITAPRYTNNGTWLDYGYLSKPEYWTQVPQVAAQMKEYQVPFWFLNVGSINDGGKLVGGVSNAVNFLNTLKRWEDRNDYHFKVFAWLNANWPKVDITNAAVRANMVEECGKLVSTKERIVTLRARTARSTASNWILSPVASA